LFVLKSHTSDVFCVDMDDKIIGTGSGDRSIKLWDRKNGKCLRTIKGFKVKYLFQIIIIKFKLLIQFTRIQV
jgi:WD40 repeat protein